MTGPKLNIPGLGGAVPGGAVPGGAAIDPEKLKAFTAAVGMLQALLKQALDPHTHPGHTMAAMMHGPMINDLTGRLLASLGSGMADVKLPKKL